MKKCEACEGTGELREWEWRWFLDSGKWGKWGSGPKHEPTERLFPLGDNRFFEYEPNAYGGGGYTAESGSLLERREKKPAKKKAGKA
jgi:hypothetical protein